MTFRRVWTLPTVIALKGLEREGNPPIGSTPLYKGYKAKQRHFGGCRPSKESLHGVYSHLQEVYDYAMTLSRV